MRYKLVRRIAQNDVELTNAVTCMHASCLYGSEALIETQPCSHSNMQIFHVTARTAAVYICLVLLTSCSAQTTPSLLLQGRFEGSVDPYTGLGSPPLVFSWPSSSVYATFQGPSINATLTTLAPSVASSQYTRFAFYLDQQLVAVESTNPNNTSIHWGESNLSNSAHNLTIAKLSEASYGQATLESLTVGADGRYAAQDFQSLSL